MIRSGGLRYCSNATAFIPDLSAQPNFEEHAKESELPPATVAACKMLDDIVKNLQETSSDGVDYFDVMVGAFAEELRIDKNDHLKNFFVIVPPLMLAYVDHMLLEKDRMVRPPLLSDCARGWLTGCGLCRGRRASLGASQTMASRSAWHTSSPSSSRCVYPRNRPLSGCAVV